MLDSLQRDDWVQVAKFQQYVPDWLQIGDIENGVYEVGIQDQSFDFDCGVITQSVEQHKLVDISVWRSIDHLIEGMW